MLESSLAGESAVLCAESLSVWACQDSRNSCFPGSASPADLLIRHGQVPQPPEPPALRVVLLCAFAVLFEVCTVEQWAMLDWTMLGSRSGIPRAALAAGFTKSSPCAFYPQDVTFHAFILMIGTLASFFIARPVIRDRFAA